MTALEKHIPAGHVRLVVTLGMVLLGVIGVAILPALQDAFDNEAKYTAGYEVNAQEATAPEAPEAPTLTVQDGALGVAWTAPADNGAAITDYDVGFRAGTTGNFSEHPFSGTGISTTISSLSNGQLYQVRVRAQNSVGDGDWSDTAEATPSVSPTGFFLVTDGPDALHTIDTTSGTTRVNSSATAFVHNGVGDSETSAGGLCMVDDEVFMVGATTLRLLAVNLETGTAAYDSGHSAFANEQRPMGLRRPWWHRVCHRRDVRLPKYMEREWTETLTRVGSASQFGVSENWPTGFAEHGGELYLIGSSAPMPCIRSISQTGVATRVGSASRFGLNLDKPGGLTSDGTTLYMVDREDPAPCTALIQQRAWQRKSSPSHRRRGSLAD